MKVFRLALACAFLAIPTLGQGTVSSGPQYSVPTYTTSPTGTTVGPTNIFTDSGLNNLYVAGGVYIGGPNPWIDITQPPYNARSVSGNINLNITCVSGNTGATVTSSNFASLRPGDGVILEGCGPTTPLGIPAVTGQAVDQSGPDPRFDTANSSMTGTSSYSYQVFAVQGPSYSSGATVGGGHSTASTATAPSGTLISGTGISVGKQTYTVSGMVRTGSQVAVTTTAANLAVAGAAVCIFGSSDSTFDGCYQVYGTPSSNTTFTVLTGRDTNGIGGANASASGGTVTLWTGYKLSWAAVTNATFSTYYVICNNGTVIGATLPGELQYVDYGATFEPAPPLPDYVPSSCPASSGNNYLATTITAGAGTANITLATAPSASVTSASAHFDAAITFTNALQSLGSAGQSVHISATQTGWFYPFWSSVVAPSGMNILQSGQVNLYSTALMNNAHWTGDLGGSAPGGSNQFGFGVGQQITKVQTAYPGYLTSNPGQWAQVAVEGSSASQTLMMVWDTGQNGTNFSWNISDSTIINTASEFTGNELLLVGSAANKVERVYFGSYEAGLGTTLAPALNLRTQGTFECDFCFYQGRGVAINDPTGGIPVSTYEFNQNYIQGPTTSFITTGAVNNPSITIYHLSEDSSAVPALVNLSGVLYESFNNTFNPATPMGLKILATPSYSAEPGNGFVGQITGNMLTSIITDNSGALGQNRNVNESRASYLECIGGIGCNNTYSDSQFGGSAEFGEPLHTSTGYPIFIDLRPPSAPTVTATQSVGSLPGPNTYYYQVSAIGPDYGESAASQPPVPCVITAATGECTVTWSKSAGAIAYNTYRASCYNCNGIRVHNSTLNTTTLSITDTNSVGLDRGNAPSTASTGIVGFAPGFLYGPAIELFPTSSSTTITFPWTIVPASNQSAARTMTLPDGNASVVMHPTTALTTTAATSDTVIVQGVLSTGFCWVQAANASAATNVTGTYVSAPTANQVVVHHAAIASMIYNVFCVN